jgi:hypothetical protein
VAAVTLVQVLSADQAQAFTVLLADGVDRYFQKCILADQRREVDLGILW